MKKLKTGTPLMGIVIGAGFAAVAILIMVIGFWRALLLLALFGIGYFLGTVENKQEFIKDTVNKIVPAKEAKVIDIKSEIAREQDSRQAAEAPAETAEADKPKENDNIEDGE